jgi:butyrate kinase
MSDKKNREHKILAINPGSTSTKIAVFHNARPVFLKNIQHNPENLQSFPEIVDQFEYRKDIILHELEESHIDISKIEAVIGRGGLIKPISSGVYAINEALLNDLKQGYQGEHASNLGGLIAKNLADQLKISNAFIADPVVVDEMQDIAKLSGHPNFSRKSIFHALNHKATGRAYAQLVGKNYEDLNLIIAHMGGGVSVGAHKKGRVIDVNQALDGSGPFSPERSGGLPAGELVETCFSGKYSKKEIHEWIIGKGGMYAYLKTNSAYEVELMAQDGNKLYRLIQDAMAYQIGKEIGSLAAVLHGEIDAIILTGGIAHNTMVVEYIKAMVSFMAPVVIYPGEDEMHSLAKNALYVLQGKIRTKTYDESNFVDTRVLEKYAKE